MSKERPIGVLFADISGTTRLYRKLGNAESQYALERCVKRMERAIEAYGGKLVMPAVDELTAVFDTADALVQGAVEMQRRLADLPPMSGVKLSIRIGAHWGIGTMDEGGLQGLAAELGRRLMSMAGAGQILTCAQTAEALSRNLRQQLWTADDLQLDTPGGECQVFRVVWQEDANATVAVPAYDGRAIAPPPPANTVVPSAAAPVAAAAARLAVRFAGKTHLLDATTPTMIIGRDRTADISIRSPKASRRHAMIARRSERDFRLIDSSTNGTYVQQGEAVLRVHEGEVALTGKGRIAFGCAPKDADGEVIEFELL